MIGAAFSGFDFGIIGKPCFPTRNPGTALPIARITIDIKKGCPQWTHHFRNTKLIHLAQRSVE
jgi:hypothetical protein